MNINNLQVQFQTAVESANTLAAADNVNSTMYYIELAKAAQSFNMGQIRTIDQTCNLPNVSVHEGWLYFVQNVDRLYFSNGNVWSQVSPDPVYNNVTWAWGKNNCGQLGDNTTVSKSSPVSVVGGFTNWCQVSSGYNHTLAVRTNGTAWGWGNGIGGRLGDNTEVAKSSPVSVVGGFTDWCQVSAGNFTSLGVRSNGTAWGWGYRDNGGLGNNTGSGAVVTSPVSVVGGFTDWCQVAASPNGAGRGHGVKQDGTLWSWGYNGQGQLGDNTNVNKSSPVSVVGGFTNWCQVSAGYFTAAVRQDGTLYAWGDNTCGRLGDNTVVSKRSPVSVVGGFTDWCQVSASTHALAVRTNGTAWSWGSGANGRLGNNCTTNRSSPVSVVGGFTDWCQVSAGYKIGIGLRQNGTVWAWGYNLYGNLGDNCETARSSPVSIVGGYTDWVCISYPQHFYHALAIRSTRTS